MRVKLAAVYLLGCLAYGQGTSGTPWNLSVGGQITTGSGSGVAGLVGIGAGTFPASLPANSFGFVSPTSIGTSVFLQPPNASPATNSVMLIGAATGSTSPFTYAPTTGTGSVMFSNQGTADSGSASTPDLLFSQSKFASGVKRVNKLSLYNAGSEVYGIGVSSLTGLDFYSGGGGFGWYTGTSNVDGTGASIVATMTSTGLTLATGKTLDVSVGTSSLGTVNGVGKVTVTLGNVVSPYDAIALKSGATGAYTSYSIGRTATPDGYWGVAGAADHYLTGTAAGDTVLIHTGKLWFGSAALGTGQGWMDTSGNLQIPTARYTAAAPTVAAAQVGFGSTVVANTFCGTLAGSAGCLVVNVAGTTRYVPYY